MKTEQTIINAPKFANVIAANIILIVLFFGTASIYLTIGNWRISDTIAVDNRTNLQKMFYLSQEEAEDFKKQNLIQNDSTENKSDNQKLIQLVKKLELILKDRPNDLKGHKLLAKNSASLGNFIVARKAQTKVIKLLGEKSGSQDYTDLAEFMLSATGGYVSVQAKEAIDRALFIDAENKRARYFLGLFYAQNNSFQESFEVWSKLLQEGPVTAPWIPLIKRQLNEIKEFAVIEENTNQQEQVNAIAQNEMILNMVKTLATRLNSEGGSAEDWRRLIKSYGVLGMTEDASRTWNDVKEIFKKSPEKVKMLRQEATNANVPIK